MKTKIISTVLIVAAFVAVVPVHGTAPDGKKEDKVMQAFDLRMNGKVDEAKKVLLESIAADSSNAMAWYELARLEQYMITENGAVDPADLKAHAEKAASLEPDNVIYAYYNAFACFFHTYLSMQQGNQEMIKSGLNQTCLAFDKVLKLKPDYHEAMLYLVDIYGMMPAEMGGDSLKAAKYIEKLSESDLYFGAKARADLMSEDDDFVSYWQKYLDKDKNNPEVLKEMGFAYIVKGDLINAEKYYREAMKIDPSKNYLLLNLARFAMYKVMRNKELAKEQLPVAIHYTDEYLKTTPSPNLPLRAYALGMKSRFEMVLGDQDKSDKLMKEAMELDPYFCRVSGLPAMFLFEKPDRVTHHYFSFFSPF